MTKSEIPENFYLYLSNMIFEDPPRNKQDVKDIINDFMKNNKNVEDDEILSISEEIFNEIKNFISEKQKNYISGKLDKTIIIEKV